MPRPFPDPQTLNPVTLPDGTPHEGTVFLAPAVKAHAKFHVGDYTYASAHVPPDGWPLLPDCRWCYVHHVFG